MPRDKLLKKKSMDFDMIIKSKYFEAFVDTFGKIPKFTNFLWCHKNQTKMVLLEKSFSSVYTKETQLVYPNTNTPAIEAVSADGYRQDHPGIRFVRGTVKIGKVDICYDFRECPDNCTLEEDRKNRDFTINSIFMWMDKDKIKFDMTKQTYDDFEKRKLRLVNSFDETFAQDPRRLLRLLRFSIEKELEIDENLLDEVKLSGAKLLSADLSVFSKELLSKRYFSASSKRDWVDACTQLIDFELIHSISTLKSPINVEETRKLLIAFSKKESDFISGLNLKDHAYKVPLRSVFRIAYFLLVVAIFFLQGQGESRGAFVISTINKMLNSNDIAVTNMTALIVQKLQGSFPVN